jgi:hypothetical protein
MTRLPRTVDFNDLAYPDLADIFRGIDLAIAAIVATDPAMRPRPMPERRTRRSNASTTLRQDRPVQRNAA